MSQYEYNDIPSLLAEVLHAADSASKNKSKPKKSKPEELIHLYKLISKNEKLKVGDLIVWKEGLKNRAFPEYNQIVIITELKNDAVEFPTRNMEDGCSGSSYRENLDLRFGILMKDSEFSEFWVDSRRFTKYDPTIHIYDERSRILEGL